MRILFVKDSLVWPRSSGHDVHTYSMMRAMGRLGHEVGLLTRAPVTADAVRGLELAYRETFASAAPARCGGEIRLTCLQERFRSYWGIGTADIETVGAVAEDFGADAVAVVGLGVLPYLGAVRRAFRVWYAADEWAWHHLSQVQIAETLQLGESETGGREGAVRACLRRTNRSRLGRLRGRPAGHALGRGGARSGRRP